MVGLAVESQVATVVDVELIAGGPLHGPRERGRVALRVSGSVAGHPGGDAGVLVESGHFIAADFGRLVDVRDKYSDVNLVRQPGCVLDDQVEFVVPLRLVVQGVIGGHRYLAGAAVDRELAAGILQRVGEHVAGVQVQRFDRLADFVILAGVLRDPAGGVRAFHEVGGPVAVDNGHIDRRAQGGLGAICQDVFEFREIVEFVVIVFSGYGYCLWRTPVPAGAAGKGKLIWPNVNGVLKWAVLDSYFNGGGGAVAGVAGQGHRICRGGALVDAYVPVGRAKSQSRETLIANFDCQLGHDIILVANGNLVFDLAKLSGEIRVVQGHYGDCLGVVPLPLVSV